MFVASLQKDYSKWRGFAIACVVLWKTFWRTLPSALESETDLVTSKPLSWVFLSQRCKPIDFYTSRWPYFNSYLCDCPDYTIACNVKEKRLAGVFQSTWVGLWFRIIKIFMWMSLTHVSVHCLHLFRCLFSLLKNRWLRFVPILSSTFLKDFCIVCATVSTHLHPIMSNVQLSRQSHLHLNPDSPRPNPQLWSWGRTFS